MIEKALSFIAEYLNNELKLTFGLDDNVVALSSLINPDGSITENIENKIILTVINLEQETTVKLNRQYIQDQQSFAKVAPPIYLNVYLLVAANYSSVNYMEALKILSRVIGVFQTNTYFNGQQQADFPQELEKLTLEIFNIPINELSHIWSGIGAKYVPSIIYKVRMITIDGGVVKSEATGISGLGNSTTK